MLMGALVDALGGLQRLQCQMLEDCLVLVFKLARRHTRAHTEAVPAPSEAPVIPASATHNSGSGGGNSQTAAGTTAPELPADVAEGHGSQSSSDRQEHGSHAAQGAHVQFANSLAAFALALPSVIKKWPGTVQSRAAAMLCTFLHRCCTCTAQISIPADAFALSTLASHQRRAIFGDTAPAAEPAAAALRVLEAAAAALRELSSEGNQDNVGSENEVETSALWEAEEVAVALGEHLLTHAALVREGITTRLQVLDDPASLLSQAERSTPFLLDAAGQIRVCRVPQPVLINCGTRRLLPPAALKPSGKQITSVLWLMLAKEAPSIEPVLYSQSNFTVKPAGKDAERICDGLLRSRRRWP